MCRFGERYFLNFWGNNIFSSQKGHLTPLVKPALSWYEGKGPGKVMGSTIYVEIMVSIIKRIAKKYNTIIDFCFIFDLTGTYKPYWWLLFLLDLACKGRVVNEKKRTAYQFHLHPKIISWKKKIKTVWRKKNPRSLQYPKILILKKNRIIYTDWANRNRMISFEILTCNRWKGNFYDQGYSNWCQCLLVKQRQRELLSFFEQKHNPGFVVTLLVC